MNQRTLDEMAMGAYKAPTLWDQTGGPVSDAHPLTSHHAASKVRSGSQKAQILIAMHKVWPDGGFTGYELATRGLVELQREFPGGPVIEAETTPGNTGQIHRLTARGVTATVALYASERPRVA